MKKPRLLILIVVSVGGVVIVSMTFLMFYTYASGEKIDKPLPEVIKLPPPAVDSNTSIEEALYNRRSRRTYKNQPLSINEVSQLLWAAIGVNDTRKGFLTIPSAGALYPLKLYLVAGDIDGLEKGVYSYNQYKNELVRLQRKDIRKELSIASLGQRCIEVAPLILILVAIYEKTTDKYGKRGVRYIYMEAGHSSQNIYLQAVSLGLGTVAIGAFDDSEVKKILKLPVNEEPLYIMPAGKI